MTTPTIAELKELCEKATEPPWWAGDWKDRGYVCVQAEPSPSNICEIPIDMDDAKFIAASRTAVPMLIAENKKLREALEKIAAPIPDDKLNFEMCSCDEAEAWMEANRYRRDIARQALSNKNESETK